MMAAIAGAVLALGIVVVLRGAFPQKASLATRLADFNEHELVDASATPSLITDLSVKLLERVKRDQMADFCSDLDVTDESFEDAAMERLKAAGGGAVLGMFLISRLGIISGIFGYAFAAIVVGSVCYIVPDFELKKKAAERRDEFTKALTAFITLVGSSISGGGGLATALEDAAGMGSGWVFVKIRNALDEAKLSGASPWTALDALGRKLNVIALTELAGSLTLAGSNGARVTETLSARADSARAKEISDIRAKAEAKSSSLGMPVGLMLIAWVIFMGYPGVMGLGA